MNYERFQNQACLARTPTPLRQMALMMIKRPNVISMGGGLPDPSAIPFIEATVKLRDGSELHIDPADMALSMQYSHSEGYPALRQWLKELQKRIHNPPGMANPTHPSGTEVIVINGSQDALFKVNIKCN
ncbi:kynurenine/alpha-aminoadipate aminotransferase, mitochondrial-like [Argopecten irradians]|uniref:kynurenine/alpha-aminoadipate aminotransferase, mitochondrial-like n=1 Tax=Argopecten irradians TaxID=31199 RepID=UPI003713B9A0